ncbi:MAG: LeuA family protein [Candidatus Kariarchaeaceae archaeon]|jgi:2-isopropylmalate synthase
MTETSQDDLIYDWNFKGTKARVFNKKVLLDDESLRDGLQSPSVRDPPIEGKLRLVQLMEQLGIDAADVGFPGASKKMYDDVTKICEMIRDEKMKIYPNCAARTHEADIKPVIQISQEVGIPVEVAAFLGSSPIRQQVEGWSMDKLLELAEFAVTLCTKNDAPVMFVTEDTTRAKPEDIKKLYLRAADLGAQAVCLSDTVGHATPEGAYNLVSYVRQILNDGGHKNVRIDWHGHRDRGLSLANAFAAIDAGADRIHGAGMGIGERCGNTPMDQLLVNLKLYGAIDRDLSVLAEYTNLTSELVDIPIPVNYPVMGDDAFRTATGVHAAAIIKAKRKGESWADTVYSGVPAADFGLKQKIEIGPLSGLSNVKYVLDEMGISADDEKSTELLQHTKDLGRMITRQEITEFFNN